VTALDARFGNRRQDWRRHVADLQVGAFEGAVAREERERVFREAFALTTPTALRVLEALASAYLGPDSRTSVTEPASVDAAALVGRDRTPAGGLLGSWNLNWPALERARDRMTGRELPPVQIFAMFPIGFTHPHLALFDIASPRGWVACWPFQVTSSEDAERQEPTLAAIAEADMHERTFASDLNWRLLALDGDG
jgi:hypothetical protein